MNMNSDVQSGDWKDLQSGAKEWWGTFTGDNGAGFTGWLAQFGGILKAYYSYSKVKPATDVEQLLRELELRWKK